ncbi:DEDD exonuclease domain-containing protein [Aeromicrobium sp. CnD17-E]|uniref:DEDD exonuclease domain-containing protein n=1 Tax=Aeromicrobium sp. CnD17-E TaxID=2954487 RepID=UPI00209840F6|nr:DEDD exonuclease domain-containing protein [Aeromicrobium sp. CnD17-E]MCO7240053.1 DEDD exonuclease domain-containing protein [Aeromicrobium sp. CnD17-E]
MTSQPTRPLHHQASFEELGRPLSDVTFCVVDLETTGGSPKAGARITEIGAVKVRGGEVLGELQTLVNPEESIPAFITVLTGITDAMVVEAPRIAEALPSFLELAAGSVLVAHNAPFDVGFLKHNARELGIPWPRFEVLDTAVLARRALLREEVRNVKLSTLAAHFGAGTTPDHRALHDARATVDVLHGLFERLGSLGVHTLEDAVTFTSKVTPEQRRKRHLAQHLPHEPGVYLFRDTRDDVLYVGTSRDLRKRVGSYFTAAETRTRMGEMVKLAERVDAVVCATALEARVRELRLIAAHRPPYNRRSRFPERQSWIKLTREPWPRLSMVRRVLDDDAVYVGPFGHRSQGELALAALHETFQVRQCTTRMGRRPRGSTCALADLGRCLAPCTGDLDPDVYATEVARLDAALTGDPAEVVERLRARMGELGAQQRYEEAAQVRDRLAASLRAVDRTQRLRQLTDVAELVAAAPAEKGWEVHVVRHGRLAAAGLLPRHVHPAAWVDTLLATAEDVPTPSNGTHPAPAASVEETETLLRWLESPGVRMVRGSWQVPTAGAARHVAALPTESDDQRATRSRLSA